LKTFHVTDNFEYLPFNAGKSNQVPLLIEPAGYFNNGNATLTYGFDYDYYDTYWDSPANPEDVHSVYIDEHWTYNIDLVLTITAEKDGHTLQTGYGRQPYTTSSTMDLNSKYYPGLWHYYFTYGGKRDVTFSKGIVYTLDKPTFETYLSTPVHDYSDTTYYQSSPDFSSNVVEQVHYDFDTATFTVQVNAAAQSGDVCYCTSEINHKVYGHNAYGDTNYLKITVA